MTEQEQRSAAKHNELEHRAFAFEVRADGEAPRISGHAAVFNSRSEELAGGFREEIAPGAFKKTLQESDIRAIWNHDTNIVLGRKKAGTLTLSEDERGLAVEITPPETQLVRDMVMEPIRRGDVDQMSFAFRTVRDSWDVDRTTKPETIVRTLHEVRLYEVSPVTFPAYPQTDVSARALDKARELRSELSAPEDLANRTERARAERELIEAGER